VQFGIGWLDGHFIVAAATDALPTASQPWPTRPFAPVGPVDDRSRSTSIEWPAMERHNGDVPGAFRAASRRARPIGHSAARRLVARLQSASNRERQVPATMTRHRVGLWLVGAFGGVGTTVTLGLAAMARGLVDRTGLVTELPMFRGLAFPEPGDFVVAGHDIRASSFLESAEEFRKNSGVFAAEWIAQCREELGQATARVRPGTHFGAGRAISELGSWDGAGRSQTAREAVDRIATDLAEFVASESVDHLVVLNVASTEPPFVAGNVHGRWETLSDALAKGGPTLLPASALYALAAFQGGHTYINFTPSLGAGLPALTELARTTGALYAGKDGKTGETLLKTALAPMFALRNLKVMSWVGHNIFGNRDGLVLDDPSNKSSKVDTKDRVVTQILGYKPSTIVTIEYLPDMGDWKTAWDHIHFQGFLGSKMALQFTWQGCDSLLAAPLAIDLVRLADLEKRRGGRGSMRHLACFFKSPDGVEENDFFKQFDLLARHLETVRADPAGAAAVGFERPGQRARTD
jgi:myo-inositol-1-phosphate synthase